MPLHHRFVFDQNQLIIVPIVQHNMCSDNNFENLYIIFVTYSGEIQPHFSFSYYIK